jgi:uncharacterized membrane protein
MPSIAPPQGQWKEPEMNPFAELLQRHPLVFAHLVLALGALAVGAVVLGQRKGTGTHRRLGWAWVLLMSGTALTSAFIREYRMPNIAGFGPVHVFTAVVAVLLPRAVWLIRQGRVTAHRNTMKGLYFGGCVLAGVFTLLPSRFLGGLLFQHLPGLSA